MRRQAALPFAALVALSACDAQPPEQSRDHPANDGGRARSTEAPVMMTMAAPQALKSISAPVAREAGKESAFALADRTETAAKLAYHHIIVLESPAATLKNRFERARTDCLNRVKGCLLITATIEGGDTKRPGASLNLRLPHDAVEDFKTALLAPIAGEGEGAVTVRRTSTEAEDLTQALADTDRRIQQLKDFRESLATLAKRKDAKVEDLITVEEKLSETQRMIEEITAGRDQMEKRVDTELLNISLVTAQTIDVAVDPISLAWRNAAATVSASTARILHFTLASLPYAVIAAPFLALIAVFSRRGRRRTR